MQLLPPPHQDFWAIESAPIFSTPNVSSAPDVAANLPGLLLVTWHRVSRKVLPPICRAQLAQGESDERVHFSSAPPTPQKKHCCCHFFLPASYTYRVGEKKRLCAVSLLLHPVGNDEAPRSTKKKKLAERQPCIYIYFYLANF